MMRREFLTASIGAGLGATVSGASPRPHAGQAGANGPEFKLKYAPHFGMFRHSAGDDVVDQLRFMASQGFTALEDNGMRRRAKDVQSKIAAEMQRLDMEMGVFVAHADFGKVTFASSKVAGRSWTPRTTSVKCSFRPARGSAVCAIA